MAKRQAKTAPAEPMAHKAKTKPNGGAETDLSGRQDVDQTGSSKSSAPSSDVDLNYIPVPLRPLAERCDSLVMDVMNVKDHGELDLPTHQASLRQFGIRRAVVVRRDNRQIEAGNGTVMAAIRNGWEYVPVLWVDDDQKTARAFALADNAIGSLALWNEENLKTLADEEFLFDDLALKDLADQVLSDLTKLEDQPETDGGERAGGSQPSDEDVTLSHRLIVTCNTQEAQIDLLKELKGRGLEVRLNTVQAK